MPLPISSSININIKKCGDNTGAKRYLDGFYCNSKNPLELYIYNFEQNFTGEVTDYT